MGAKIAKVDIKSVFRLRPVHPTDFERLGIQFKNNFYIDKCLPMGNAISCNLFEKFSTFIQWVINILKCLMVPVLLLLNV